ncbi:MAG: plasmid replication protein RepC [Planctomycetota bacterium]
MRPISSSVSQLQPSRIGGRVSSYRYRQSLEQCEDFSGLEETTNRYDLLLLVKKLGKLGGFTSKMIELLDYYMAYTRDHDWEEGSRPIVYQSVARTALQMGVSERQIRNLENKLFEVGAITWNDSGNHKRYGSRDPNTDRIVFAYGVDLTPLAYLRQDLEAKLQGKILHEQVWISTRREISECRRQIRSLISELVEEGANQSDIQGWENDYQEIAYQLRTHIKLADMRTLLAEHRTLHSRLLEIVDANTSASKHACYASKLAEKTSNSSPKAEKNFSHYKYSNPEKKIKGSSPSDIAWQKSVVEPSEYQVGSIEENSRAVSLKQVLLAASDRFRAYLPMEPRAMNWSDVHEAAHRLRADMFISKRSWQEACHCLGRTEASLCVLITDRGRDRTDNRVIKPAAYFRGMINKARVGELNLHKSIYGLLAIGPSSDVV